MLSTHFCEIYIWSVLLRLTGKWHFGPLDRLFLLREFVVVAPYAVPGFREGLRPRTIITKAINGNVMEAKSILLAIAVSYRVSGNMPLCTPALVVTTIR